MLNNDRDRKRTVAFAGLLLFVFNLIGFVAFRYYISDDLYGGDVINFAVNKSSYFLQWSDIQNYGDFFSRVLSGKNKDPHTDPGAFVWRQLSGRGRQAMERLSSGPYIEKDKDLFILEFNKCLIDPEIDWPAQLIPDAKKILAEKQFVSNREYNGRILTRLFPQINYPAQFNKISLSSLMRTTWKSIPILFTIKQPTRYSPLTNLYVGTMQLFLDNSPERIMVATIINGIFYALLMTLAYFLAMEVFTSIRWAFFSVLLFQASVPAIISVYSIFSLPYLFVPLVMVAAFVCYLRYKKTGQVIFFILFVVLSIFGPWFREFSGLIPFIVLVNEIVNFKNKRSNIVIGASLLLIAHSIYPSLLTRLVGLNKGDFFGVYAQNNGQQLVTSKIRWMTPGMVLVEIPFIIWILSWVSMGFWVSREIFLPRALKFLKTAFIALLFLVPLGVACFFFAHFQDQRWQWPGEGAAAGVFIFSAIFILTTASLRFNTLMPLYFMIVFIPFMRISGNTEVHMSFALLPLSIMLVLWIREAYRAFSIRLSGVVKNICLTCLSFFFIWGMTDQILNVRACATSQKAVVRTNKEMAEWIKTHLERHCVIVCNFYNFPDIFYYSGYYFDPYETVENCPLGPSYVVHKDRDFQDLLQKKYDLTPVYLLSAQLKLFDYQRDYHEHKYVKSPPGRLEWLASFEAKNIYYYIDPLKYFVMRRYQPLPLYMDWSIDFYYNNEPSVFKRVVKADYTLYRLSDLSIGFPEPEVKNASLAPKLVDQLNGYNITGKTREEIDKSIHGAVQDTPKTIDAPRLVTDYKKYNIVYYNELFYAVPQSLGPLDLSQEKDRVRPGIIVDKKLKKIKKAINNVEISRILVKAKWYFYRMLQKLHKILFVLALYAAT